MNKVSVRLSTECQAALGEAEAHGINNSEFIRSAILSYYSSGSWRTQVESEISEKSITSEELPMSVTMSDRMSDAIKAETPESKPLKVERIKPVQQMYSPRLDQPHARPQSRSIKWTASLVSALVIFAVVATCLAIGFENRDHTGRRLNGS